MVAILSRGRWVNGDLYMIVAADWTDGVLVAYTVIEIA